MSPGFWGIPLRKMAQWGSLDIQAYLFSPIVMVGEAPYIFQIPVEELGPGKYDPCRDYFGDSRANISKCDLRTCQILYNH